MQVKYLNILYIMLFGAVFSLAGCDDAQKTQEQALQEQAKEQGYPVLIATPVVADYGLPFCEKKYCIDIEIQSFHSQDQWFNRFTDQQIAELIRKQLGLTQALSLQQAVDAFVQKSDSWQLEHENQPWSMQIYPLVPMQQKEIALLQIQTAYKLGDKEITQRNYFFMVDRKQQKQIRLYDIVKPDARLAFGAYIQQEYTKWREKLTPEQQGTTAEKIYWASQDWLLDEQGLTVYYRSSDLQAPEADNLIIQISKNQAKQWFTSQMIQQLSL